MKHVSSSVAATLVAAALLGTPVAADPSMLHVSPRNIIPNPAGYKRVVAMPANQVSGLLPRATTNMTWEEIVKLKREERDRLLPAEYRLDTRGNGTNGTVFSPLEVVIKSGILTAEELDITDTSKYDATETLRRVAAREISVETLVNAFIKRATAATSLANFLTEINFDGARERAKWLDQQMNSTGPIGPLHGLPITIKDTEDLEGFDSSYGITGWAFDPMPRNGPLIQILINAGAVIIGKTNVPQTVLAADSDSVIWGRTLNAHKNVFGAGGSTGGEGSCLGTGSSLFGVASDGAGSSRMPAMANGVVGYRPSGYRVPTGSYRDSFSAGRSGLSMTGPVAGMGLMGHSVRDLRMISQVISAAKPWEQITPFTIPWPWMNVTAPARPRIGVWNVDTPNTYLHLFPPVLRGYKAAQDRLRTAGFELVEFTPPDMSRVWEMCKDFLLYQGIETLTELISKEPITKIVRDTDIFVPNTPRFPIGLEKLYELNIEIVNLALAFDAAWNSSGKPLDALLSVTAANTALPWDTWHDTTYTTIYNSVDWPAITLPLNMVADKDIDAKYENFQPYSPEDARLEALYDPEAFHGLPLSVQLACRKFEDEKLLAIAELIHPIIRGGIKPPGNGTRPGNETSPLGNKINEINPSENEV